jgi:glycosyltransferase involved in cell wall biosynthesis
MDSEPLYVVVPAYCEAGVIAGTVAGLLSVCPNVVVIDDGSADATAEQACAAGAAVVRHPVNLGQGAALQTGIVYALQQGARFIATFDADGQHRPQDIAAMLDTLRGDSLEIVLGSRFLGQAEDLPPLRRAVLKAAVLFTRLTTGLKVTDTHNGLRVMTADAARQLNLVQDRMAHASEMLAQIAALKLTYKEVPVTVSYSDYSLQKGQRLSGAFRVLADLVIGWLAR